MAEQLCQQVKNQVQQWLAAAEKFPPSRIEELSAVMDTAEGLAFLVDFIDGVIRTEDAAVAAEGLRQLLRRTPHAVLAKLPAHLRLALQAAAAGSRYSPTLVMAAVKRALRALLGDLLVSGDEQHLDRFLQKQQRSGRALNINLLGEAILGWQEAQRRLAGVKELIQHPGIDYVSLKVSAVTAPHNPWGFEHHVQQILQQLTPLYQQAAAADCFINLDMEEYRDLELTLEVFEQLLSQPELTHYRAGIVLQAYLPDAFAACERLHRFAEARVADGGAPIKIRLVKGANLPMEKVQAALHGWAQAPVHSKEEADANYLILLDYCLSAQRLAAVELGIAGHNLFDIALAWQWICQRGLSDQVRLGSAIEFEALLGMNQAQMSAVAETIGPQRFYTPVVAPQSFDAAIAYLVRRVEESADAENFLSTAAELGQQPELFEREYQRFCNSYELFQARPQRLLSPHRTQDRAADETAETKRPLGSAQSFHNSPDSDPALAANRQWAQDIADQIRRLSEYGNYAPLAQYRVSSHRQLNTLLNTAAEAAGQWQQLGAARRGELLRAVATELASRRSKLAAIMGAETGKTLAQADPEISEAIDFACYYAAAGEALAEDYRPVVPVARNITVVTPPWNFPLAIPAGSVLAALAAGSAVIVKPAPEAPYVAEALVQACWDAGISPKVLQLAVMEDGALSSALLQDPRVDQVILTGAWETAELFHELNPQLRLFAETSGKNAMIVTPSADYDQAVADIVASAFGHAGQKCSAASLLILVGAAGRSERFYEKLVDATTSLITDFPDNLAADVGPLIHRPEGKLAAALNQLEPCERWVVPPRQLPGSTKLYSPGIKAGVRPGSAFHHTEYFGPVLGVMLADDLAQAVAWANAVDYGLTAGLHSLNPVEIQYFQRTIQAGNVYINRGITGAIVQRQPFGGWKKSAVGAGKKAGGPNYLLALTSWRDDFTDHRPVPRRATSLQWQPLIEATGLSSSQQRWLQQCTIGDEIAYDSYFQPSDPSQLGVESNILRYFSAPVVLRYLPEDDGSFADFVRSTLNGLIAAEQLPAQPGTEAMPRLQLSVAADAEHYRRLLNAWNVPVYTHNTTEFIDWLKEQPAGLRVRSIGRQEPLRLPLSYPIYDQPPVTHSIIEGQSFVVEQAVSITTHRFGSARLGLIDAVDYAYRDDEHSN